MQNNWLSFIYDDEPALVEQGKVLVYGKDFSATVVHSCDDEEVRARLARFDLINRHRDAISRASRLVTNVDVA